VITWQQAPLRSELFQQATGADALPAVAGYQWQDGCLVNESLLDPTVTQYWDKSAFQGRAQLPFTTTRAETLIFERKLRHILQKYRIPKDAWVMDVGCSDGRATRMLLDAGYERIVASDIEHHQLARLVAGLAPEERPKVWPVAEDVNTLPFQPNAFHLIVAWGLFTSTPDFKQSLEAVIPLLHPDGILVSAEPILESILTYALVRGDLQEFLRSYEAGSRPAAWEDKENRYQVFRHDQVEALMSDVPLEILERDGISLFPSLVFGGVCQDQALSDEEKATLFDAMQELSIHSSTYFRQVIYVSRKRESVR
jgi:SAM-dependent methyltransferase